MLCNKITRPRPDVTRIFPIQAKFKKKANETIFSVLTIDSNNIYKREWKDSVKIPLLSTILKKQMKRKKHRFVFTSGLSRNSVEKPMNTTCPTPETFP